MIFSDNYTVHERYSLISGERLSDYSIMPWLYTPLVDSQYKPVIPVSVKNALNRVFEYDYFIADVNAIMDEIKHLGVYSVDDQIQSYNSILMLQYTTVKKYLKDFKIQTATLGLTDIYQKIDDVILEQHDDHTSIIGAEHSLQGDVTGLSFQSRNYDVSSYNNPLLEKLVAHSKRIPNYCKGILTIKQDDKVSFYSSFVYPKYITEIPNEDFHNNILKVASPIYKKKVSNRLATRNHIGAYLDNNILTIEQVDVINSLEAVTDTRKELRLQVEHVFKGSELIDVILHVVKYNEFENTSDDKVWYVTYDENGNPIW